MAADLSSVVHSHRNFSEFVFSYALNVWEVFSYLHGNRKLNLNRPLKDPRRSNGHPRGSSYRQVNQYSGSIPAGIVHNNNNNNNPLKEDTLVPYNPNICSCHCHCVLKVPGDVACVTDATSYDSFHPHDNSSVVNLCPHKVSTRSNRGITKSRHMSADHIKCIKGTKIFVSCPVHSIMRYSSTGHEKSACDQCDCVDSTRIIRPSVEFQIPIEYREENFSINCCDQKTCVRVLKENHDVSVQSAPCDMRRGRGIQSSNSDPALNNSMYSGQVDNCNNENINYNSSTLGKKKKLHRDSNHNNSFHYKSKNLVNLQHLNVKTINFKMSTKTLTKKLSFHKIPLKSSKSSESVIAEIGPVDPRHVVDPTKLTSKYGKLTQTGILTNMPLNLNEKNNKTNKLNDKSMIGSLRRRKKSFKEKFGTISSSTCKVGPSNGKTPYEPQHVGRMCGVMGNAVVSSHRAWDYEAGINHLHHKDCPCGTRPCSADTSSAHEQLKDEMADVTAEMETLEGGEDSKNNPKSKQMSIGRKKFNMDPKKGIEYLIEHSLLKNTPDDISKFLYNGEGLNKTAIGDYLGERHDFNVQVLDDFVALHDFTDLILVQALRQFLWSFRLPGEAQKIDRMMERFASHYCELNPSIFKHPDTCFVLSFAIIMLNTSLHNTAVKDKQTLEQFITMNRGIDNGTDLPRALIESLFESIKTEPFKIPEDDGNDLMHTFFNPDREGWLWKQGGRYKSWKRRWFILNDNCLYYFEYTTDKEPRGIIPLENIEVREVHDRNKPNCFELYAPSTDFIKACKTDSEGKVVEGKHTVYRMSAATSEEKEEWIKCIRQSISHNPFYDLLAKRKKNIQKTSS